MAATLQITDVLNSVVFNFLTGYLRFQEGSWNTTPNGDGTVIESVTLVGRDTEANVRGAVQTLTETANSIELWFDEKHRQTSYWFAYKADTESAKRALIYSLQIVPMAVSSKVSPLLLSKASMYQMILVRDEAWENLTTDISVTGNDPSIIGGEVTCAAIDGSEPGRLIDCRVNVDTTSTISKIWMGIHPDFIGATTSFVPLWEAELGTVGTDAAITTDSTASPGGAGNTKVTVTWSTTTLTGRVRVNLSNITGITTASHMFGKYMVLVRHKEDAAGSTIGLQLGYGMAQGSGVPLTDIRLPESFEATSTTWRFSELGIVDLPPIMGRITNLSDDIYAFGAGNFFLRLYAERVSGSGASLDIDCFVLIPYEHYLSATINIDYNAGTTTGISEVDFITTENGEVYGTQLYGDGVNTAITLVPTIATNNWSYPVGGGVLVVAGGNTASTALANQTVNKIDLRGYTRSRVFNE